MTNSRLVYQNSEMCSNNLFKTRKYYYRIFILTISLIYQTIVKEKKIFFQDFVRLQKYSRQFIFA